MGLTNQLEFSFVAITDFKKKSVFFVSLCPPLLEFGFADADTHYFIKAPASLPAINSGTRQYSVHISGMSEQMSGVNTCNPLFPINTSHMEASCQLALF